MKALYLTISLLVASTASHAGTCIVQQANSESMKKLRDSSEINIKRNEKDVELVLSLPSEMEKYPLKQVALEIKNRINGQIEFFVPVATDPNIDGKVDEVYMLLTLEFFESADLVINYGRCAWKYRLSLQELDEQSQAPKPK